MIEQVEVVSIIKDKGTQHRLLEDKLVLKYAEMMKDGIEFNLIHLYNVNGDYILVDGFHRLAAYEHNEVETIEAEVTKGTMRDAIWASLSTNKHGMPATDSEITRKLDIVLKDESWKIKSLREIAEHVGCSHEKVRKHKIKLEEAENPVEINEDMPCTDDDGEEIPQDLIETFAARGELDRINKMSKEMQQAIELCEHCDGYENLNIVEAVKMLKSVAFLIEGAKPYKPCPICNKLTRDTCEACNKLGYVTKKQYQMVNRG